MPAAGSLPAALTRSDVKDGMSGIKARVQVCYDKFKQSGIVTIKVRIEPDGSVSSAEAVDSKFRATDTGTCVADAVRKATFRKFSGAPMTLNYPFSLE